MDGDRTAAILEVSGRTVQGVSYTLDEGASFYIVTEGQQLTQAVLESAAVVPLAGVLPEPLSPVTVGNDFWVGARIREGLGGGVQLPWSGLGWAHLRFNEAGLLTIVSSAVPYHESSLVVGQVPEPSSATLAALGLAGWGCAAAVRRRRVV